MMSNEEMVRNVFRRTDEYFQKKEKRNNKIKKGVSFMSLFSIITLAGLGLWSSTAQNEAVPDIPEQISIIETVSLDKETTTMESAVSTYEISESTSEAIVTDKAVTTGAETVGIVTQIYKAENTTAPVTTTVTTVVPLAEENVAETTAVTTAGTTVSTDTAAQTTESAAVGTEMTAVTTLETEICQDTRIWTGEVDGTYGDLTYIVCNYSDGDCIEILSCEKDAVSVEIPEEIEGLPVRFINREAFLDCADLKSVTLPENLENMSHHAFWGCHSLEYLYIPKNVNYIGATPFVGCTSLKNIDVAPENECYRSENGILFEYERDSHGTVISKENEYLICYPTNHEGTEYVVPDSVIGIFDSAFYANQSLTSVILPEGLKHILPDAFKYCTKLVSMDIPDSVDSPCGGIFHGCTNLASVKLPGGEATDDNFSYWLHSNFFGNCINLKSVTIPEKFKVVFDSAFSGCTSLESIIIENPECEIWCDDETVTVIPENTVIYGYSNSKAQEYAETYGRKFVALDAYTFEELLALSAEEICAISDKAAEAYTYGTECYGQSQTLLVWADQSSDHESFMLPDGIECELDGGGQFSDSDNVYDLHAFTVDSLEYGSYDPAHVQGVMTAWLAMNPVVVSYEYQLDAGTDTPESVTGDIDGNGTVDISDATAVLSLYAEGAAGITPAIYTSTEINPADVNGDGVVSVDDATAILLYYAQTASGLSPEWADIINK